MVLSLEVSLLISIIPIIILFNKNSLLKLTHFNKNCIRYNMYTKVIDNSVFRLCTLRKYCLHLEYIQFNIIYVILALVSMYW